jgi:hypothetical protein
MTKRKIILIAQKATSSQPYNYMDVNHWLVMKIERARWQALQSTYLDLQSVGSDHR